MKKYLQLTERVGDEGIYGRDIILAMDNNIVLESHIITPRYADEDILKGMKSDDLDMFVQGDENHEWQVSDLDEKTYNREINRNKIARFRQEEKMKNVDLLELKARKLSSAERTKTRDGKNGKSAYDKMQKRTLAYKKMLNEKYMSDCK